MKSVLISIQPKWCELIASGIKTVEVRKTRPKIDTPFKCYIYETNWKDNTYWKNYHKGKLGKVIGEFVCNNIETIDLIYSESLKQSNSKINEILKNSCLSAYELLVYLSRDKTDKNGYAWYISDLVIYDKPKELSKYRTLCKGQYKDCRKCGNLLSEGCESTGFFESCYFDGVIPLTRPPQIWCYVEELKGGADK